MDQIPPGLDLCLFPAGKPPSGTITNFENPETLVSVLISITVIMTVGAVLFTSCRIFANRHKLWWSDYFVIIALIFFIGNNGLMLVQTKFARHQWDVRACWYNGRYTKILFTQDTLLNFVTFFTKTSIFLLYHQIFHVAKHMRMAIRFGILFSGLIQFTNISVTAVLTAPHVGETWASVVLSGRLQKSLVWGVCQSVLGILLDLFIFVLPIPVILKLKLSRKRKIQFLAVFTTGLVAKDIDVKDGSWTSTSVLLCAVVENAAGIIVSCTPGVANFTQVYISESKIMKTLRSTFGKSSSGISDLANTPDPNRPRTKREPKKRGNNEFSGMSDISKNAVSHASGEDAMDMSLLEASRLPGIV